MEKPLSVVVTVIINENNEVLLIKRQRGVYPGLWAIPGGKIERGEFVRDAALREALEETGLKTEFVKLRGVVSEHYYEEGKFKEHFLLHVVALKPVSDKVQSSEEGSLKWFDLFEIDKIPDIVPSDLKILQKMILRSFTYFNSVLEKNGKEYVLKEFS